MNTLATGILIAGTALALGGAHLGDPMARQAPVPGPLDTSAVAGKAGSAVSGEALLGLIVALEALRQSPTPAPAQNLTSAPLT